MTRWLAAAMLLLPGLTPMWAEQATTRLEAGGFNSAKLCSECHEDIFTMWNRSMHSAALSDPIFDNSYKTAYLETRGAAKYVCLRCHAPVAAATGDLDLANSISREGITCDFCHSVVLIDPTRSDQPFEFVLDGRKRGPLADAESPVHGVVQSKLHESAEFCAGCHEYANDDGLPILSTYSEWKGSPQAAEGKTCQVCHMPVTAGRTVRSGLTDRRRRSINLHDISGMHSSEQVRKAASTRILDVRQQGSDGIQIDVEVANIGSGHSIPTGLPTRKLRLEVLVFSDDQEVKRFERTYQKVVADERGAPITEDHRSILEAKKILQDNRLRPGEKRVERFVAGALPKGKLRTEIRLRYIYEPRIVTRQRISIDIAMDRRDLGR